MFQRHENELIQVQCHITAASCKHLLDNDILLFTHIHIWHALHLCLCRYKRQSMIAQHTLQSA